MKILLFVGDRLRHFYFANKISKSFDVVGTVVQERTYVPKQERFLNSQDKELFDRHFRELIECEEKHFLPFSKELRTESKVFAKWNNLNCKKIKDYVALKKPDLVLSFGVQLLDLKYLGLEKKTCINFHGGISPYFKGVASTFWAMYFMKPQYIGATFHLISSKIDAGDVLIYSVPVIKENDSLHDIGCNMVKKASKDIVKFLKTKNDFKGVKQKGNGKLFLNEDFLPCHLRSVYQNMDNGFVKEYLNNKSYFKKRSVI